MPGLTRLALDKRLALVKTSKITVNEAEFTSYPITYDVIAVVSDADVYLFESSLGAGFLLLGGIYMFLKRSKVMKTLCVKSVAGTTDVWIAEFILKGL